MKNRCKSIPFEIKLLLGICLIFSFSCNPNSEPTLKLREHLVREKAQDYFDTFADRTDWDKLCSFYRVDLQFDDVLLQISLDSLWKFKRFYNWDGEGDAFQKLSPTQKHLTLKSLVVNDSIAVANGRINPFYYHGELVDSEWGMNFTIWLYFDDDLLIKRQIDWMEYDPDVLESTVRRYREHGFQAIPEWLDLSR